MRKNKFGWFFKGTSFLLVVSLVTGCLKSGSSSTPVSPVTYLSLINGATFSPTLDLYLNDALASTTGLQPGSFSQQYSPLQPGMYDVKLKQTGTSTLLAEIPSSFYDSVGFYTLIFYNLPGDKTTLHAAKITDDLSTVSSATGNYRFFNLSPNAPAVDLYFNLQLTQSNRAPADNVANPSYNAFQIIGPNNYAIVAKKAGTDSVLASNNLTINSGNVYTLFLSGTIDSSGNKLLLLSQQAAVAPN